MARLPRLPILAPTILLSLALAACGGSDSSKQAAPLSDAAAGSQQLSQESGAPLITGNMATDGLAWFNFRRQQIGLPKLTPNSLINTAAQGHSEYQKINNIITHDQTPRNPGFTGINLEDRLSRAGYNLVPSYAIGEVIAQTGYTNGFTAAEALITAIYHRFVIFEPIYKDAGAGYATAASGYTYFTTDFAATNGLGGGLGARKFIAYPFPGQTNVPPNFFSDSEEPDPVPNRNEVGYPISLHADINQLISNVNFNVRRRGAGTPLATQLLASQSDPQTPTSGVAIIPLEPLNSGATYDVAFSGSICTISPPNTACISAVTAISQSWSFTTK
ncbi:MAG: CAP domain-containing protein [Glaciimonas sp.]|nr:CAP domain-containing protein [Glaciimonas sp.]